MALDISTVSAKIIAAHNFLRNGFMHLPYVSLVDDTTIRLRDNSFMKCIRLEGLNAATSTNAELEEIQQAFSSVIAQLPVGVTVYVHKVSRKIDLTKGLEPFRSGDFAEAVDARWTEHLSKRELRDTRITISVVRGGRLAKRFNLFSRADKLIGGANDEKELESLAEICRFIRSAIGSEKTHILKASEGDLYGFLGSIQTGIEQPRYPSKSFSVVADDVLSDRVTFKNDHFELSDGPLGDRFGQIRALKSYAPSSWVTVFDDFAMPCDFVISQCFEPLGNNEAASRFERTLNIMNSTADARAVAREQLAQTYEQVLVGQASLGNHQLTVSIIDQDKQRVRDLMSGLDGVASNIGTVLVKDNFAKAAHYFSQFPGNRAALARMNTITNDEFANFASLHRSPLGKDGKNLPWETPIAVFPTVNGSQYRFSFHRKGSASGEPPAGHTLILGETGSGKSVLANFLLTQARRTDTRIFVFDYRRGLEMAVKAMGGSYSSIESGRPTGLNPLWVETDEEGVGWLTDWLSEILSPDGNLEARQTKAILDNVKRNADASPILRRWDTFAKQFASADDKGELQKRVSEWAANGRFGWVFGETTEDTFSLDGKVVGFDLTQILDAQTGRERTAVLSYIFRRIERKMQDRKRTIVLIDEAWKAIGDPYFATVIEGWLATLRKQNAVVVMLTQNPDQLIRSKVGERIFSFFPTQILFPDGKSSPEDYRALRLNAAELDIVTSRLPGRNFLVRDDENSTVLDGDMSALENFLHILGGGEAGLSVVGPNFRDEPDFWRKVE